MNQKNTIRIMGALVLLTMHGFLLASPEEDGKEGIREYELGNMIDGMELMYKSANAGYAPAQAKLGYILDQSEENEKAVIWFRKAAEQGNVDGQYGLGIMYAKGDGVEKTFSEAIIWIKKAADQGHLMAMRTYATALENGELGISKDEDETLRWLRKAADQGDAISIRRLAQAYRWGELGLVTDTIEANKLQAMIE
jgi:TPR repeat protein